jgi:hypothetical protein
MQKELKYISDTIAKELLSRPGETPIYLYKGSFNYNTINSHLKELKNELNAHIQNLKIRKRLYSILVECFENINKHALKFPNLDANIGPYGFIMITVYENSSFQVVLGNFILNTEAFKHKERLETVNNLDLPALKEYYTNIICNTEISERGGAGLGLVDMAIKSENKLKYNIYPYDDEKSLFVLNITLTEHKQLA